jgi:putative tryptophan/tyrosine transport system substrate-binding protein
MRRREFIAVLLGGSAEARSATAWAQAPRTVRIGILASSPLRPIQKLRAKLAELGYLEGVNTRYEYRFAEGRDERFPELAAELVALRPDVIVTWGTPAALAAKRATGTVSVPIIFGAVGEALRNGLVASLARPGGNISGFSSMNIDLEEKRIEALRTLVPGLSRMAILSNPTNPVAEMAAHNAQRVAETWGVSVELLGAPTTREVAAALTKLNAIRPDAVVVIPDTMLVIERRQIVDALAASGIPAVYAFREFAEAGGLMVYGADLGVLSERAATYVDKVLNGENPGDLPVQQATEFELIINLKAAAAMGLTVPTTLLARADEVIE